LFLFSFVKVSQKLLFIYFFIFSLLFFIHSSFSVSLIFSLVSFAFLLSHNNPVKNHKKLHKKFKKGLLEFFQFSTILINQPVFIDSFTSLVFSFTFFVILLFHTFSKA
jgi:hypothetical protein